MPVGIFQASSDAFNLMGRWEFSTTALGVLELQTNTKTGKLKGVSKPGKKVSARVWCPRRRRQMHLGQFNSSEEAAAAVAHAEAMGPENLPTPKPRKPRCRKEGMRLSLAHTPRVCQRLTVLLAASCVRCAYGRD